MRVATGNAPGVRAVLFDMDGTLVDTEEQTDIAITAVMQRHGHPAVRLPPEQTRGRSWPDVVAALRERHPIATLTDEQLVGELTHHWAEATRGAEPIPGAVAAVTRAAALFGVAVVSSSPRALIDRLLAQIGVDALVPCRIGADEVRRPKPHPEGFLAAAARLAVRPDECVVFEDSRSGLEAARAAGMASMLVLHRCAEPEASRALATGAFRHYDDLPADFWQRLRLEGPALLSRDWRAS